MYNKKPESIQRTITIKYVLKCRQKLSDWVHQIDECLNNFEIAHTNLQMSLQVIITESVDYILTKPELYALLLQHDLGLSDLQDDLKALIGFSEGLEKANHLEQCVLKLKLVTDILGTYSRQNNAQSIVLDYSGHSNTIKAISNFYKTRVVRHDTSNQNRFTTFGGRSSSQHTDLESSDAASVLNNKSSKRS